MDLFHQKVTQWYHRCGVKNCTCCLEAYSSGMKRLARRLARKRLRREAYKEVEGHE